MKLAHGFRNAGFLVLHLVAFIEHYDTPGYPLAESVPTERAKQHGEMSGISTESGSSLWVRAPGRGGT